MKVFRSKSKKGRGGFLKGWGVYLAGKELFLQGEALFLQQGRNIGQKGTLFAHVNEP